jgi:hypothetical protein
LYFYERGASPGEIAREFSLATNDESTPERCLGHRGDENVTVQDRRPESHPRNGLGRTAGAEDPRPEELQAEFDNFVRENGGISFHDEKEGRLDKTIELNNMQTSIQKRFEFSSCLTNNVADPILGSTDQSFNHAIMDHDQETPISAMRACHTNPSLH